MDKKEYYDQIHIKIAQEIGLQPKQIETIRSFIFGENKTPEEAIKWLEEKIKQPRRQGKGDGHSKAARSHIGRRRYGKKHYQDIIDVLSDPKKTEIVLHKYPKYEERAV